MLVVGCGDGEVVGEADAVPPPSSGPECLRAWAAGEPVGESVESYISCFDARVEGARFAAEIEALCYSEVEAGRRVLSDCDFDMEALTQRGGCMTAGVMLETLGAMVGLEVDRREGAAVSARAARVLLAAAGRLEALSRGAPVPDDWGC